MSSPYKGWSIKTFRQMSGHPYKPYVSLIKKETKDQIFIYNVEGISERQCVIKAQEFIDELKVDTTKRKELMKPVWE
jgi:transposase